MEQIDFEDVNERIDQININNGKKYELTPPISELKTYGNFLDVKRRIEKRFIIKHPSQDWEISEELYDDIAEFMLEPRIPYEEKEIVNQYIDDKVKQYIFNTFFERAKKTDKNFYLDRESRIYDKYENVVHPICYNPRINGVPLKTSFNSKITVFDEQLYDILSEQNFPNSVISLIALRSFFESHEYFDMPWCIDNAKMLKEKLKDEKIEEYIKKYIEMKDKEKIQFIKNSEKVQHDVKINEDLNKSLFSNLPEEFSQMEKAIYLYIRLCQRLTYDDAYFYNAKIQKHTDVSNITNYNGNNNKVVCYVFSYIYSELLRDIGVNYIRESEIKNGIFSNAHANIEFLIDDIAMFADSTTTIENGDLINAKSYSKLVGIRCMLLDGEKQKKFKECLNRIYNYIKEQDGMLNMIPQKEEVRGLDITQKFKLFNRCLENSNFYDIDLLSYIEQLREAIFTKEECQENVLTIDLGNLNYQIKFNNVNMKYTPSNTVEYILNLRTRQLFSDNVRKSISERIDKKEERTKSIKELIQEIKEIQDFSLLDEIEQVQRRQEKEMKESKNKENSK